jgi:hypothetical protein
MAMTRRVKKMMRKVSLRVFIISLMLYCFKYVTFLYFCTPESVHGFG